MVAILEYAHCSVSSIRTITKISHGGSALMWQAIIAVGSPPMLTIHLYFVSPHQYHIKCTYNSFKLSTEILKECQVTFINNHYSYLVLMLGSIIHYTRAVLAQKTLMTGMQQHLLNSPHFFQPQFYTIIWQYLSLILTVFH